MRQIHSRGPSFETQASLVPQDEVKVEEHNPHPEEAASAAVSKDGASLDLGERRAR